MNIYSKFTWTTARQTAESLIYQQTGKYLSDLEVVILRGAWEDRTYEQISEARGYTSNYLSRDIGCKLWLNLSGALQEKVSKKNFKAALQREWQKHTQENKCDRDRKNPTLTTANLTFPEGFVSLDSPFYIERSPVESICYEMIAKPGSLIRIKGAKWMGKTSLVHRILANRSVSNHKTVYIDFANVERAVLQDLNKLLRWLCAMISRQLELSNRANKYWDKDCLGNSDSCTIYFEEYILAKIDRDIVLAFDNIDRLFCCPEVIEDLLSMLSNWHLKGKIDRTWSRLKLVLAHSTEVYIPLGVDRSLFYAGVPILLEEFNYQEVKTLASVYELNWQRSQIEQLMDLVGGYPYLIRLAMYQIKNQQLSLKQFLGLAISHRGIYHSLLLYLTNFLHQSPALSEEFTKLMQSQKPIKLNLVQLYKLHSVGLVKHRLNLASPRCKLYRCYFDNYAASNSI